MSTKSFFVFVHERRDGCNFIGSHSHILNVKFFNVFAQERRCNFVNYLTLYMPLDHSINVSYHIHGLS